MKIQLVLLLFLSTAAFSQVGIGTTTPAAGAVLDLTSTSKGFLLPRVANTTAVTNPVNGMVIYDNSIKCIRAYEDGVWSICLNGTNPASGGTGAVSAYVCNTASAGTMTLGIPVSGVTQTITATVTTLGTYSITATANGVTFSGTGTFAVTGAQAIVLTATGTPTAAGTFSYELNTTPGCSFDRRVSAYQCGAFVASGVYKTFACYNLDATNTLLDPNVPVEAIHGNYYQWGRIGAVANTSTGAGAIAGWNTTAATVNSWGTNAGDTFKNPTNDPCPAGFRVPSVTEWNGVINSLLNTVSRTGSWANNGNFTTAIHYGPSVSVKTLTLPAAGYRDYTDGTLGSRGNNGYYWSSTENGAASSSLYFTSSSVGTSNYNRPAGFSVRCISE